MSKLTNLQEKIVMRANEDAQKAIQKFRSAVSSAIQELLNADFNIAVAAIRDGKPLNAQSDEFRALSTILSPEPRKGFPATIWRTREQQIEKSILSQMDILQRVLIARDPSSDDSSPDEPPNA